MEKRREKTKSANITLKKPTLSTTLWHLDVGSAVCILPRGSQPYDSKVKSDCEQQPSWILLDKRLKRGRRSDKVNKSYKYDNESRLVLECGGGQINACRTYRQRLKRIDRVVQKFYEVHHKKK